MQRALPRKRQFGSAVSIRNAGGAVYLKTKIGVFFPLLHVMGNPTPAPFTSRLESKVFLYDIGLVKSVWWGYGRLL